MIFSYVHLHTLRFPYTFQFIDSPLTYGTTPTTYYFQTRIYLYICICVYTYLDIDSTVHWLLEKVAIQFLHGYYRSKGTIKRRRQTWEGKVRRCRGALRINFELIQQDPWGNNVNGSVYLVHPFSIHKKSAATR